MYESFYGFREKPFNLTPDPRFLYLSKKHKEAFAHLLYGIRNRSGFVEITGEIGTGKTTICRTLLEQIGPEVEIAFIFNPYLSATELLRAINEDFGISSTAVTKKELIDELNAHLLERRREGKNCVLLIDEAQNLSTPVLEQIRLLSNLETDTEKLLPIILVGQPELKENLAAPELRQLDQRITARYHLKPLDYDEMVQYIAHRITKAGGRGKVRFTVRALKTIYKYSGGTPRLINAVCDRALLIGYTQGKKQVDHTIIKRAVKEIQGGKVKIKRKPVPKEERSRLRTAAFVTAAALIVVAGAYYLLTEALGVLPPGGLGARLRLGGSLRAERAGASPVQAGPAIAGPAREDAATAVVVRETVGPPSSNHGEEIAVASAAQEAAVPSDLAPREESPAVYLTTAEREFLLGPEDNLEREFMSFLRSLNYRGSKRDSAFALAGCWGIAPDRLSAARASGSADIFAIAGAAGLRCSLVRADLEKLRLIGVPAILELFLPGDERPVYVCIAKLRTSEGQQVATALRGTGETAEFPFEWFESFWYGRTLYFWREFEKLPEILRLDYAGTGVKWVQMQLKEAGIYSGELTGTYDDATSRAVAEFQKKYRVEDDGIAGPNTRMAMYAALDKYETPKLVLESPSAREED